MAPTLVLVPTPGEAEALEQAGGLDPRLGPIRLCGFGPVAAAAVSARLVAVGKPERVLLLGIAGTWDPDRFPPGSALDFSEVILDGIGAGEGAGFLGPAALGLPQWPGAPSEAGRVVDRLPLGAGAEDGRILLTVCACSDSQELARRRRQRFPDAVAEDMEGFGVALACHLAGVPLRIVRGLANRAGDRDREHWQVGAALSAARTLAHDLLQEWEASP